MFFLFSHQLKRGYALNLSILVSAAQKQKLTRIPLVTASESGKIENDELFKFIVLAQYKNLLFIYFLPLSGGK